MGEDRTERAWRWVSKRTTLAMHEEALADFGGTEGVRDEGMLESALMRPVRKADYGDPDAADLAAAYAFGIVHNHPFVDGNKRTGLLTSELFLALNGFRLGASNGECVLTFLALAAGEIEEDALAEWFRGHIAHG